MKAKMGEEKFNASKFPAAGKILVELMTSPNFMSFSPWMRTQSLA